MNYAFKHNWHVISSVKILTIVVKLRKKKETYVKSSQTELWIFWYKKRVRTPFNTCQIIRLCEWTFRRTCRALARQASQGVYCFRDSLRPKANLQTDTNAHLSVVDSKGSICRAMPQPIFQSQSLITNPKILSISARSTTSLLHSLLRWAAGAFWN